MRLAELRVVDSALQAARGGSVDRRRTGPSLGNLRGPAAIFDANGAIEPQAVTENGGVATFLGAVVSITKPLFGGSHA